MSDNAHSVCPPSLASAVVAQDVPGILAILDRLESRTAQAEQSLLGDLLAHPSLEVARAAAGAVCRLRIASLAPQLRLVLIDTESVLGSELLAGLEGWTHPEFVDAYRQILETHDYPWKDRALRNLSHYSSAEAGRLMADWANRPEPELALPALIGLRKFPSMVHYRLAREALTHPVRDVVVEAARTVAAVGGRTALRELLRWSRDAGREIQVETLRLVREHGDSSLGGELEPWLLQPDDDLVVSALSALRKLEAAPGLNALRACAENPEPKVRAEAMRASKLLGSREAAEVLELGLADAMPEVQTAAVETLASLDSGKAKDLLRRAVSSRTASTRIEALKAIYGVGWDEANAIARHLLSDPAPEVRKQALRMLAEAGELPPLDDLSALLADPDPNVRATARKVTTERADDSGEAASLAAAGFGNQAAAILVGDIVERGEDPRPIYQLGILLYGRGTYEAALEKFLRVLELEPRHQGAQRYIAWTQEQLGNREAQLDAARRLCDLSPEELWAQRLLGVAAVERGNWAEAQDRLDRVAAAEPDDVEAAVLLGEALLELGSIDPARRCLERGLAVDALSARSEKLLSRVAVRQGRLADAQSHLERSLASIEEPDSDDLCTLAWLALEQGRPADAVKTLKPAARRELPPARVWLLGARAALALDRPADALAWIDRCRPLDSGDQERRELIGESLRRLGRHVEALPHLEQAAGEGPSPSSLLSLARCQAALGNDEAAVAVLERYHERAGHDDPWVQLLHARVLRRSGRAPDALRTLESLSDWKDADPSLHHELARCHLLLGAAGEALRHARLHHEAVPASLDGALTLGEALVQAGELADARPYLQELARRPEARLPALRLLVTVLHGLREPDALAEVAEKIAPEAREDAGFCAELGLAHHVRNRWRLAKEWLGRAVRLGRSDLAVLSSLSESELKSQDFRGALEHATLLCERYALEPDGHRLRGLALMEVDRAAEAIPYLRKALELLPDSGAVRSALAEAYTRVGDDEAAVALYPDKASLEAATERALVALAGALDRSGRRGDAIDMLEHHAALGKLGSDGLQAFSALCLASGDVLRAEGLLNTGLKARPGDPDLLESRGELLMARGRLRAAEQDLARVMNQKLHRPKVIKLMGSLRLRIGAAKEAGDLLSRYVRLAPNDPEGFFLLARSWMLQDQAPRAEKCLRTALDLDGQNAETAGELVALLLCTKRREEARTLLAEFTGDHPERLGAVCERASRLAAEGHQDETRWLQLELARLGAPVEGALLPLVLGLVKDGKDREAWKVILEFGGKSPDVLPALGDQLMGYGRHDLAKEVYRRSYESNGRNVSDLMGVARCHLELGEKSRARSLLVEVRNRCPMHVEAGHLLAQLMAEAGERDQARVCIEQVLSLDPDHVPTLELKIEVDLVDGDIQSASRTVEECLKRDFGRADFHLLKAAVARRRGHLEEAEDALLWAAGLDPANERAACEAALTLRAKGDLPAAKDVLSRLLSANPASRRARLLIPQIMADQGDLDLVLQEWHEAEKRRRLSPEEIDAFIHALWAAGEEEEAARRVNQLRLEQPGLAVAWMLSAQLARRQKNLPAAIEFLDEAVRRKSNHAEAHAQLADCHQELGSRPEGIKHARLAVRFDPDSREHRLRLAGLLAADARWEEAALELDRLVSIPGEHHAKSCLMLARVCLAMGNRSRTIDLLAAQPDPDPEALALLGDLYFEDRNWDKAADAFGRLAARGGQAAVEHEQKRAEALLEARRLADAAEAVRSLLSREDGTVSREWLGRSMKSLAVELARAKRGNEALDLLDVALSRAGTAEREFVVDLHLARAGVTQSLGRRDEVEKSLAAAFELAPAEQRVLDAMAGFHAASQDFETLSRRMQEVVASHPKCATAHLYLGAALCRLGMPGAGKNACERAAGLAPRSVQAHLGLARAARQSGDLEATLAAYQRVLELSPDHKAASSEMTAVLETSGLMNVAVGHYQRMMAASGQEPPRPVHWARPAQPPPAHREPLSAGVDIEQAMLTAAAAGRWHEARGYADSILRIDERHLHAMLTAARAAMQTADANRASKLLRTALELHPSSPEAHAAMARYRDMQGDPDGAREEAYRAAALDPAHAEAALILADLLLREGRADTAETLLRESLMASPQPDERLRCEVARLCAGRGDRAAAVQMLAEPPVTSIAALQALARLRAESGDWKEASLIHARLVGGGDAAAHQGAVDFARTCLGAGKRRFAVALARDLARAGKVEIDLCLELDATSPAQEADQPLIAVLESAIAHLPATAPAQLRSRLLTSLARQLRKAGRHGEAEEKLLAALALSPDDRGAQDALAALLVDAGQLVRLRERFVQLTAAAPLSAGAQYRLADAHSRLGESELARDAAARAADLEGGHFGAQLLLARMSRKLEDFERATAAYRAALAVKPNDPRLLYELAMTYASSNLQDLAQGQWRKLLRAAPAGSELAAAADSELGKRA